MLILSISQFIPCGRSNCYTSIQWECKIKEPRVRTHVGGATKRKQRTGEKWLDIECAHGCHSWLASTTRISARFSIDPTAALSLHQGKTLGWIKIKFIHRCYLEGNLWQTLIGITSCIRRCSLSTTFQTKWQILSASQACSCWFLPIFYEPYLLAS